MGVQGIGNFFYSTDPMSLSFPGNGCTYHVAESKFDKVWWNIPENDSEDSSDRSVPKGLVVRMVLKGVKMRKLKSKKKSEGDRRPSHKEQRNDMESRASKRSSQLSAQQVAL